MDELHTPGPWSIQDDHGKRWIETTRGNDDVICEVSRRNTRVGRHQDAEFEANATLISAAPDLLGACVDLHEAVDWLAARLIAVDPGFRLTQTHIWTTLMRSISARAKAVGERP